MKYAEIKNAVENNLKYFLKWAFLSILIGCAGGLIGGVFGLAIKKAFISAAGVRMPDRVAVPDVS